MNLKKKYDWVLFDLDNTLTDFTKASHQSFKALLENHLNLPFSDSLYSIYKAENKKVWDLLEEGKITTIELRKLRFKLFFDKISYTGFDALQANEIYLNGLVEFNQFLPDTKEVLEGLSDHVNLAIITNGLKEVQRPALEKHGITSLFRAIVVSDEIGSAKPAHAFFEHAYQKLNRPQKHRVLVVGDSLNSDIKGGNDFGFDTYWFNPNQEKNNTKILPTKEIQNLTQLLDF